MGRTVDTRPTAKASTPVAINAIATMLESISLVLLLSNSDNIGLDSGDRGLTIAVLGNTVSYRPTAKIILPIAINTIAVMLEKYQSNVAIQTAAVNTAAGEITIAFLGRQIIIRQKQFCRSLLMR